jgi:hypothetical protein
MSTVPRFMISETWAFPDAYTFGSKKDRRVPHRLAVFARRGILRTHTENAETHRTFTNLPLGSTGVKRPNTPRLEISRAPRACAERSALRRDSGGGSLLRFQPEITMVPARCKGPQSTTCLDVNAAGRAQRAALVRAGLKLVPIDLPLRPRQAENLHFLQAI